MAALFFGLVPAQRKVCSNQQITRACRSILVSNLRMSLTRVYPRAFGNSVLQPPARKIGRGLRGGLAMVVSFLICLLLQQCRHVDASRHEDRPSSARRVAW